MSTKILSVFIFIFLFHSTSFSQSKNSDFVNKNVFDISQTPTQKEWQTFFRSDTSFKENLWHYHLKQGKNLEDWSWSWRMAWVKSCHNNESQLCKVILSKALIDKAAVVRAESATILGNNYRGKENNIIIKLLANAYSLEANMRNQKPLFVQKRILYAITQIGGVSSKNLGAKLSQNHAINHEYWQKITKGRF